MEEARLKENLPQEGTGQAGESLPEQRSGCPTYSGGGKVLLPIEKTTQQPEKRKTLTQQIFHPGLFNRPRSASLSDVSERSHTKTDNAITEDASKRLYNPNAPWQRVPTQKRHRSPDEKELKINQAKRTQLRDSLINKHRGLQEPEHDTAPDMEISNSFSLLDVEEAPTKKTSKPPPIILYGVDDLAKLTQLIDEVVEKNDYTYKVVSRNQLIISSNNVDKYKILIEHIRSKGLIGHTFTCKDQKCMRIVIKHLHFSTPKEAIVEAIEKTGNKVQGEIVTARKQGTKDPLNTFFVNIAPHNNNKLVKDIKVIYNQKVTIEDPIRKTTVVQCKRCQQYGHSKNNCMRPYRCVKCAGPHKTTMCTIDKNTPAVCTLCSGSHPASYKGCQVYKEVLARKQTGNKQPHQKTRTIYTPRMSNQVRQDRAPNGKNNYPPKETAETSMASQPKSRQITVAENLELYSRVVKGYMKNTSTSKTNTTVDLTNTQKTYPRVKTPEPQRPLAIDNADDKESQRTNTRHYADQESQRTYSNRERIESYTEERRHYNLEELMIKQTERIDQLITQLGTMMNLIMTIISKLPQ